MVHSTVLAGVLVEVGMETGMEVGLELGMMYLGWEGHVDIGLDVNTDLGVRLEVPDDYNATIAGFHRIRERAWAVSILVGGVVVVGGSRMSFAGGIAVDPDFELLGNPMRAGRTVFGPHCSEVRPAIG